MKRIDIDKDVLIKMYIDENMNVKEIAEKLNLGEGAVYKNIRRYEISKSKELRKEKMKQTCMDKYGCSHHLKSNIIKEKRKKTNLEKYGVENVSENENIKNKIKETFIEKYGVDNPLKNQEVQNKRKDTCIKKYGVENPSSNSDIKEKRKQTFLNKYGYSCSFESPVLIEKRRNTFLEKYGYEYACQNEDVKTKIKKTNLKRYGCEYACQNENIKNKIKKTNLEKYGVENPFQSTEIKNKILETKIKNNGFIFYDKDNTKGYIEKTFIEKPTLREISDSTNYSYSRTCQLIRKYDLSDLVNMHVTISSYEKEIYDFLISLGIKNIERSNRNILNGKEIDIYLPDYKIGIEFNGSYWHSDIFVDKNYHYEKSKLAHEAGVFIYHIFEYEWNNDRDRNIIKNQLKRILFKEYSNSDEYEIKEISDADKKVFLNKNHIHGNDDSSVNVGLFYKDIMVELMTFKKSIFNNNEIWELSRHCCDIYSDNYQPNKIFEYFICKYLENNDEILSYSDISKDIDNFYTSLNFELVGECDPQYVLLKKINSSKIDCIEESTTSDKYMKVYDCGKKIWKYKKK